ncbi:hypothetical protein E6B08_09190 [Pseudomonas putida]|uniref:Uncharacterized protein n=1 Tax=Pseudomonas putida TaxID=303 RepID=A0A4D6XAW7_PSEPU|nr:hypothetical protein [Pseudomonas putida]QCI11548.1 hypothetical protein E6B08_09190 [Pseudomonas putida]
MKFEDTFQRTDMRGIVYNVSKFTLTSEDRPRLRELHFGEAKQAHYLVSSKVVEVYDKMQAGQRPCLMLVGISRPLTRRQGDELNASRSKVSRYASSAAGSVGGAVGSLGGPFGATVGTAAAGGGMRMYVEKNLPTYHAGDILVSIEAQVSGGIGPQRTLESLIIKV